MQPEFPHMFCVKTRVGGRDGYFLMQWSLGHIENDATVHILKGTPHRDRFYNIETIPEAEQNHTLHTISTRKGSGNVVRPIRWAFTHQRLRYHAVIFPVLRIMPMAALPSMKITSFIPIVVNIPAPIQPAAPQPTVQAKKYTMDSIPQHIIRALLRDAVMQEEVCPITSVELDIANGAVTSCFHLFEKNAIMKWLLMPASRDKCPVCNCPCNSYTLE